MNTGSRLQIAPDLQLVVQPLTACDLTGISILLGNAGDIVTNKQCPSFIQLMGHDDILQMLYDNGNLTLDEKSNGGLYEVETILDEVGEWFADSSNVVSCILGYTHEEMGVNIHDDKLTAESASEIIATVIHYIKTEINITDLPFVHVDCMAGE